MKCTWDFLHEVDILCKYLKKFGYWRFRSKFDLVEHPYHRNRTAYKYRVIKKALQGLLFHFFALGKIWAKRKSRGCAPWILSTLLGAKEREEAFLSCWQVVDDCQTRTARDLSGIRPVHH